MKKIILITGATDGIGLETAKMLVSSGHTVLLHGRNLENLQRVEKELSILPEAGLVESYLADLSKMSDVVDLVKSVTEKHDSLDVLINNAGVYKESIQTTPEGLETRFAVNTIAPYLLTKQLLPLFTRAGRVINLSSAAQFPVDPEAVVGRVELSEGAAYAQSKLALTMWSRHMALSLGNNGPAIIAVNPRSMLGSKMVKEAYGVAGGDLRIGAEILVRAALSDEFSDASGKYFDNDIGEFCAPHRDALDPEKCRAIVAIIEDILAEIVR